MLCKQPLKINYGGITDRFRNNAAAKKYDLEAWFPFQQEYKELVSCSNCKIIFIRKLRLGNANIDGRHGLPDPRARGPLRCQEGQGGESHQKSYGHFLKPEIC